MGNKKTKRNKRWRTPGPRFWASEKKQPQEEWNEIKWYGLSLYFPGWLCVWKVGQLVFALRVCCSSFLRAGLIGVRELNLQVQHTHTRALHRRRESRQIRSSALFEISYPCVWLTTALYLRTYIIRIERERERESMKEREHVIRSNERDSSLLRTLLIARDKLNFNFWWTLKHCWLRLRVPPYTYSHRLQSWLIAVELRWLIDVFKSSLSFLFRRLGDFY